jgi:AcrR family transcriptional regulator
MATEEAIDVATAEATSAATRPGKGAATRAAILERAVDLASTEGLEGLTIGKLASDLGMSKSGLFAHFGSKEELQLATVDAAAARFVTEVVLPAQAEPEGLARLRAYCELHVSYLERQVFAGGCFWAAASAEFDDRPGPVHDAVRAGVEAWLGALEYQAAQAGAPDPAGLAFEVYSLMMGANSCSRLLADPSTLERARAALTRRLDAVAE